MIAELIKNSDGVLCAVTYPIIVLCWPDAFEILYTYYHVMHGCGGKFDDTMLSTLTKTITN